MNRIRQHALRAIITIAATIAMTPAPASAQLGGLKKAVKRAATEAAGPKAVNATAGSGEQTGAVSASAEPAMAGGLTGKNVIEMTDDVIVRFERALATETTERQESARILESLADPRDFQTCAQGMGMTPEYQRIFEKYLADVSSAGNDNEAIGRSTQVFDSTYRALAAPKCGRERNSEIERELQNRPIEAATRAGEFTRAEYAMLKERVEPFCEAGSRQIITSDGATVPGSGHNIRWVYTAAEVQALTARCRTLSDALAQNS
jgi:hypothetical protein